MKLARIICLIVVALAVLVVTVPAGASEGGDKIRRIDTSEVNQADDVHAVGASPESPEAHGEGGKGEEEHGEDSGHEASEEAAAEHGGEAEEEGHHPAWMIPGWQSIFAALAVAYFAFGVFVLPRLVAKEEGH